MHTPVPHHPHTPHTPTHAHRTRTHATPPSLPLRLDVQCSSNLSTEDLETELYLHILHHCAEYVDVQQDAEGDGKAAATACEMDGDGMGGCVPRGRG